MTHFMDCVRSHHDPLIFSGVKHVLYRGNLDLSRADTIEYRHLTGKR